MTVGGTLYGMPYFLDPRGMYYRKDLFEAAGLGAPKTFADVREAAKALHNPPALYGIGLGARGLLVVCMGRCYRCVEIT